jgi:hypothetical protein
MAIAAALPGSAYGQPASIDNIADYLARAEEKLALPLECPEATGDEIVVCGRRDEAERYRLPIRPDGFDPKGSVPSVSRERHELIQEGNAGIGSCSAVGSGGFTGCFHQNTKRRCEQETCGFAF